MPDFTNPQSLNRYSWVLGNPLRFVDPTGHFEKDEIMASLIEQYGEAEALRMWELWLMDVGWMNALYEAEFGSQIWYSYGGGRLGTFELAEGSSHRIIITWLDDTHHRQPSDLWEWQGKGGYQVMSPDGTVEKTACHTHSCSQPLFQYDTEGRIMSDQPFGWQSVVWEKNLFGMTWFWFDQSADIAPAQWGFTGPWLIEAAKTVAGWLMPVFDKAHDAESLSNPLFPLTVSATFYHPHRPGIDTGSTLFLPEGFQ